MMGDSFPELRARMTEIHPAGNPEDSARYFFPRRFPPGQLPPLRQPHLPAVPVRVLELAGALLGKRAAVARLTGSFYVDSSAMRSRLGWVPPFSMEAGLAATVADRI